MKNAFFSFLAVLIFVASAQAFTTTGEAMVSNYQPMTGIDQKVLNKLAQQGAAQKKAMDEVAKMAEKSMTERNEALNAIASSTKLHAEANGKVAEALGSYGKKVEATNRKVDATTAAVKAESKNLGEQVSNNAWILGGLIVLAVVILIIVAGVIAIAAQRQTAETIQPAVNSFKESAEKIEAEVATVATTIGSAKDEILAAINASKDEVIAEVFELPAKVAKAVHTLDASPFEFEAAGHQVTYQSPTEGITDGYYLLLHVPKDMLGAAATYDRAHETSRGVAIRNCRKTMQKFLNGDFKVAGYELQTELIGELVATGALSYRKIS